MLIKNLEGGVLHQQIIRGLLPVLGWFLGTQILGMGCTLHRNILGLGLGIPPLFWNWVKTKILGAHNPIQPNSEVSSHQGPKAGW